MLLCLKYSSFALRSGERVTDYTGGGELMALTIETADGSVELREGEIFKQPRRRPAKAVYRHDRTRIYRMGGKATRDYAVYDMSGHGLGTPRLMLFLSIPAQWPQARDADFYRRLEIRDTSTANCPYTFSYWM